MADINKNKLTNGKLNTLRVFEIEEKFLMETTKCSYGFECLENENHVCLSAKVALCIGGKVHFIDCPEKFCKYKMDFGNGRICSCPTRKEIYNKYGK